MGSGAGLSGMEHKRVTLFAGHYGSGKSNLAVNYAIRLAEAGLPVRIADLDIVNPYFRAKDCAALLAEKGVELICSEFANSNVDVPAIPGAAYAMTDDRQSLFVADVGGDEQGARALGRFSPALAEEGNYEMFLVINRYRPLTRTPREVLEVKRAIEQTSGLAFTAIANNSNLGVATTADTVLDSLAYAEACAELTGLPVRLCGVWNAVAEELKGRVEHLLPLQLSNLQIW